MVSSFVLENPQVFPVGTSLDLFYAKDEPSGLTGPPQAGTPLQTQVVGGDSKATFTSLTHGTQYTAVGEVGSTWRRISFSAPIANNRFVYSVEGQASEAPITDFGLELLDLYDAAEARALLGADRAQINVKDYGAVGDGNPEPATPFQNAYNDAAVLGRDVFIPAGTYYIDDSGVDAVISLPRDNARVKPKVHVYGEGGTIIKLSSNTPRFIDFNKIADHDVFRAFALSDIEIDANNVTGSHHVIIGTHQAGTNQSRISLEDLTLRRIRAYNIASTSAGGNRRYGIDLGIRHPASDEATQDTIKRILCEDVRLEGGCYGMFIGALVDDSDNSANVYLDEIELRRCFHDPGGATAVGNNFHIGSTGFGNRCLVIDCEGVNSSDSGLEINAQAVAVVERTTIIDPSKIGFADRNFRAPENPEAQQITYHDCVVRRVNLDVTATNPGYGWGLAGYDNTDTDPDFGHVLLLACRHEILIPITDWGGTTGLSIRSHNTSLRRLTVEDFTVSVPNFAQNIATNSFPSFIFVAPARRCQTTMHDIKIHVTGSRSGAGNLTLRGFILDGIQDLDLDNIVTDFEVTGMSGHGQHEHLYLGAETSTLRGSIRRFRPIKSGDDTAPIGVRVGGTAALSLPTRLLFENCDFSGMAGVGSEFSYDGTSNAANVKKIYQVSKSGTFTSNDAW